MTSWTNGLATIHRYLGIAFCLLFAMWFATAIVMLFQPYPALSDVERFTCLPSIGPTLPASAIGALLHRVPPDAATRVWLTGLDRRLLLHVSTQDGIRSYWADDGSGPVAVSAAQARSAASGCGLGTPIRVDSLADDQWTVHQRFNVHRPLYRVKLDDPAGSVLYVSSRTGGIVQRTTRVSRAWNWLGSVPHWIYPTVIRRHWALWDSLVWWLAGAGTFGVAAGLVIGLLRWRRSATSRVSPFRGTLYWHHVTGLGLGVIVLAWIFSGMLSMDHGRLFSTDAPTDQQVRAIAGNARFEADPMVLWPERRDVTVKEIEWLRVGGRGYLAFRSGPDRQRIVPAGGSGAADQFNPDVFAGAAAVLMPDARLTEQRVLDRYDTQYYGTESSPRPLPILRLTYDDPAVTWFHLDLATGAILERVDARRRAYRYWFNALHSHDLPWMLARPRLRRTWMTVLCLAGLGFSANGVWLAWKRVRPSR